MLKYRKGKIKKSIQRADIYRVLINHVNWNKKNDNIIINNQKIYKTKLRYKKNYNK